MLPKMVILSNSLCTDVIIIIITFFIGIITYFKWMYKYWERRNVPYIKPSIPFGSVSNPIWPKYSFAEETKILYNESKKKDYKYVGIFSFAMPMLLPIDVELIKNILSNDFIHFINRGFYFNEKDDPLSAHLVSIEGQRWKNLRTKLTPTFTSGKMKMMFGNLLECGNQLTDAIEEHFNAQTPVDIKDIVSCFTTDVIGSCAFGINCNSFRNPNSDFRKFSKQIFSLTPVQTLKVLLASTNPKLGNELGICSINKDVSTFFSKIIKDTVEYREKNKINRNDFLQILIDLKNNTKQEDADNVQPHLTIEELMAQCFLFFAAGFETSSTATSFCLFELAQNQNVQDRVRDEINTVLDTEDRRLTYDTLKEMKYMKQVIDEALRKYPPLPFLNRKCVLDYKIPNTNITIEKDTNVIIPLLGLHYDPEHFPEPEQFNPDRFNKENKKYIKPFTYMPFGDGPRVCIGLRFAIMQTGIGLTYLLRKFRFSVNKKTKLPFKMDPYSFSLSPLGDIWLNIDRV